MTARANKTSEQDRSAAEKPAAYKRRYPRFVLDVRMQEKMFQGGEFQSCWGRSTELGQGGIGATLTGNLEVAETLTPEIPLPLSPFPLKDPPIPPTPHRPHHPFNFLPLPA